MITRVATRRWGTVRALALVGVSWLPVACDDDGAAGSLPDWSDGYERSASASFDAGPVAAALDAGPADAAVLVSSGFSLRIPRGLRYPTRLARLSAQSCEIPRGSTGPAARATCILDINELDLSVEGFALEVVAPEEACEFVHLSGYIYANYTSGPGPTVVRRTIDHDGTVSEEVNSVDGKPACPHDHRPAGPNCCTGQYQSYTTTIERLTSDAGMGAEGSRSTSLSEGHWGGRISDCYGGGAFVDEDARFSEDGWPLNTIVPVAREAQIIERQYGGISEKFGTNLPLANYWAPEDHGDGMPQALRDGLARPFYEYTCLDHAGEIIAQIRLLVREWNQEHEFESQGDPDTWGQEPDRWGSFVPINDLIDWRDATPGAEGYPEIPGENH